MKFVAAFLASAALACSIPAVGAPPLHADTVDPSLPTQLPRTAIPHHYAITVTPNAERLSFNGDVAIDLEVIKPTGELVLNAADLQLASAVLRPQKGGAALPAKISLDPKSETATLTFARMIAPGVYRLAIRYSGRIHTQANGLFALDYKNPAGAQRRAIFTQFEPADSRRFFPGWDEPDYKATFDLTARVPASEMAVSNMPASSTRDFGGGLKEVRFQPTPVMSSYLLFFGSGDFGRITKMAGKTEVGIVMGRGNESKARTALDAEAQILPYYNDYFGTPYPLPKLDNVAGPGQSQFFSAMENWGAIFTFERVLLDDPAVTTESERQAIFGVEAHEMAHQWFGDLVTMAWWDDLWLNEGFASWMASKATKHFHPDWGEEFGTVGSREGAMGQDALSTDSPHRSEGSDGRAGQPGLRFDHLLKGRIRPQHARRLCRCRRLAARHPGLYSGPRLPEHSDRRSVAGGGSRGRQGPCANRPRLHAPARRAAHPRRRGLLRCRPEPGHPHPGRVLERPEAGLLCAAQLARAGQAVDRRRGAGHRLDLGARDAGDGAWLRTIARERRTDRLLSDPLSGRGGGAASRQLHAHRPARRIWPRPRPIGAVGSRLPADGDRA